MNDEAGDVDVDVDDNDDTRVFDKFSIEQCNFFEALKINLFKLKLISMRKFNDAIYFSNVLTACNQMIVVQDSQPMLLSIRSILYYYHSAMEIIIN